MPVLPDERRRGDPTLQRRSCRGLGPWIAVALLLVAGCGTQPRPLEPPRGIVLIVLDTLRADGLSAYGNPRDTSPAIDSLATRGVLFENAMSHAPWTLPSFIGLLSGRYPSRAVFSERSLQSSLLDGFRTAGWSTAAFTEGGYVSKHFGIDRGFEVFEEEEGKTRLVIEARVTQGSGSIERTFDGAIEWLRKPRTAPFFLLVHTYEIHFPYRRREYAESLPSGKLNPTYEEKQRLAIRKGSLVVGDEERKYVRALYDGGVHIADTQVRRLLDALDETGVAKDTVVVVTADHGEDLGGRDPRALGEHGHQLYDDLLRVPLIVYHPRADWPAGRVDAQARLVDVMPTLLDFAGLPVPAGLAGASLVPLLRGREEGTRLAYSELRRSPWNDYARTAMRDGRHKLIANLAPRPAGWPEIEFYDLTRDPNERENLVGIQSEALDALTMRLKDERDALRSEGGLEIPEEEDLPPELRERLEALGYLETNP
jgi:arylsulfatase A-like enzyme